MLYMRTVVYFVYACIVPDTIHVRVLLSFQQPTFQTFTQIYVLSAARSAFHLNRVIIQRVSSEILKCRLLKLCLDHPMSYIYIYIYICIYTHICMHRP